MREEALKCKLSPVLSVAATLPYRGISKLVDEKARHDGSRNHGDP